MKQSLYKEIPLVAFGFVWVCFIFLDYWNKHPFYTTSFEHFRHANYSIFLGLGVVGFGLLYQAKKAKSFNFLFSGLSLFILALLLSAGTDLCRKCCHKLFGTGINFLFSFFNRLSIVEVD